MRVFFLSFFFRAYWNHPTSFIMFFSCAEREAPPARRPLLTGGRFFLGSIRPYLVAARKWYMYSEADVGPGAEAGAGFGGRCCD